MEELSVKEDIVMSVLLATEAKKEETAVANNFTEVALPLPTPALQQQISI